MSVLFKIQIGGWNLLEITGAVFIAAMMFFLLVAPASVFRRKGKEEER